MEACGKFRGIVVDNVDPLSQGRLMVKVPDVSGEITAFAMPCLPYAGPNVGFFARPPVDANVWVEFERGDVNFPIWTGCFWGQGEAPPQVASAAKKFFAVPGVSLTLDDTPGQPGITLEVPGQDIRITITAQEVLLKNQRATIRVSDGRVSVNEGALEVV